ncbi:MAG: hypothetical protein JW969_03025 [Spirochaetales bacterium]|nr:hypothetical protein [Spirochaetales bacterium]
MEIFYNIHESSLGQFNLAEWVPSDEPYDCTAPAGNWLAYVGDSYMDIFFAYDSSNIPVSHQEKNNAESELKLNNIFYPPYRPQYAYKLYTGEDKPDGKEGGWYASESTTYSAGVDCGGMVQRSASYYNTPYKVGVLEKYKDDGTITEASRLKWGKYSAPVSGQKASLGTFKTNSYLIDDENLIVPGDCLLMEGHIVFVAKIVFENTDDRSVSKTNVRVIEATPFDRNITVLRSNMWGEDYPRMKAYRFKFK